jgi:hypothetical protein
MAKVELEMGKLYLELENQVDSDIGMWAGEYFLIIGSFFDSTLFFDGSSSRKFTPAEKARVHAGYNGNGEVKAIMPEMAEKYNIHIPKCCRDAAIYLIFAQPRIGE